MNRPTTTHIDCHHRFFDRHGGVSKPPFASLNISFTEGDQLAAVAQNRSLIKHQLGIESLVSGRQIHGDQYYVAHLGNRHDQQIQSCDALLTADCGVGLMIQQADCQAVLLYDDATPAIGAVHCGWRGSVARIIEKTIGGMTREFGTNPAHLNAFIGPSLGPCCAEFVNHRRELPEDFLRFQVAENHFDFWQISLHQLIAAGVPESSIMIKRICTSCSPDYFSYRRARRQGRTATGRHCSVIVLSTGASES